MTVGWKAALQLCYAGLAELKAELVKWMFLFWLGTVATMLGLGRLLLQT